MLCIDSLGATDRRHIPAVIARLVAAENQLGASARIEREEDPQRSALMLYSQLLQVAITRPF
jgi:hypothetical protein